MKPTKNQVFCFGCKHHKMLFESQAKADNFIKFNSDEIAAQSGKAPSRSYYCSFCCGWHITSISDAVLAADRDERDAQVWEQIQQAMESKKKKVSANAAPTPKPRKFPKSEQGIILREISLQIDKAVVSVESALLNADIHRIRTQFDRLLKLENELRTKSSEYGIDVKSIDKRYIKISGVKALFSQVFDYFIDRNMRQSYLSSLSPNDMTKRKNLIIHNIETIDRINACFDHIKELSYTKDREEIRTLCKNVMTSLIPQLKGVDAQRRQAFISHAEDLLSAISHPIQYVDEQYKGLILSIITHLENAHKAYNENDFESCDESLYKAEMLMPGISNDIERTLNDQIVSLRGLIS